MKFLRGLLFIVLGLASLAVFVFIAWKFWDFFNDPGWKYTTLGDTTYKSRVEGGQMWFIIPVFLPFGVGAFFAFREVGIIFGDSRGFQIFLGICLLLLVPVIIGAVIIGLGMADTDSAGGVIGSLFFMGCVCWGLIRAAIGIFRDK